MSCPSPLPSSFVETGHNSEVNIRVNISEIIKSYEFCGNKQSNQGERSKLVPHENQCNRSSATLQKPTYRTDNAPNT